MIKAKFMLAREAFKLDVDLSIPNQGVSAIFGPSGCGKTTLLRAIAGLEANAQGYLQINGNIWQDENRFVAAHHRSIGYVFQEPSLFVHLNTKRNIEYGLKRLKPAATKASISHITELLGIDHLLMRYPYQLSGGEKQRVAIARAIAVNPSILLLDEPLAALDLQRKQEILPYIESIHQTLNIPVLYVSHSRNEVVRLADHMILMDNGKVQATGLVSDLFSRLDLSLAHGADTESVIEVTVAAHDDEFNLSYLDFSGGRFSVTYNGLPIGKRVRLQVKASDVSITLGHQSKTSILNIFPATIDAIETEDIARVTVRLLIAGVPILVRVTRKSALELDLAIGKQVYVQVKSVALC